MDFISEEFLAARTGEARLRDSDIFWQQMKFSARGIKSVFKGFRHVKERLETV